MLPLRLFRDRVVHGRPDRGVRDLGVVLRDLPLHHAVPAADPRPVRDRGRPGLPAGHDHHAVRLRRHRPSARDLSARLMVAGGLALVAVGMVLFTLADVDSSWTIVLPGAMVALIGTGLFNPALTAVALGRSRRSRAAWRPASTTRSARPASPSASRRSARSSPREAAFGGSPQEYVNGLHDALSPAPRWPRSARRRLVPHLPPVRRRGAGAGRARGPGRGRARARPGLSRSRRLRRPPLPRRRPACRSCAGARGAPAWAYGLH